MDRLFISRLTGFVTPARAAAVVPLRSSPFRLPMHSATQRRLLDSTNISVRRLSKGKNPKEQAGPEYCSSESLAVHHQGRNPASGDVYECQTLGSH
ncbi:hypothetical protein GJAV_G00014320 [Gymnothorax javanicus]|nr:hypothetical protein GJAV_G00014320 [Gymnothorax javanicus]